MPARQCLFDGGDEIVEVEWLNKELKTVLICKFRRLWAAGDHYDRQPQTSCMKRQVRTQLARHQAVEGHCVHRQAVPDKDLAHSGTAARGCRPETMLFEHCDEDVSHTALVIHHQNVRHFLSRYRGWL